jgi:hypothetical protein
MKARLRAAARAALIHLAFSIVLVASVTGILFYFWFRGPYLDLFDGLRIVLIAILVDIVCGPLITAVVYNPAKSRRELTLDLSLVVMIQLAALAYGIHVAAMSRPVALVFEVDRFVAVAAGQVNENALPEAPEGARTLPLIDEPKLLGAREPKDNAEMMKSIERSLAGEEPSVRPDWWQDYAASLPIVKKRMKKLSELEARLPEASRAVLAKSVAETLYSAAVRYYLPLTSQKKLNDWIVLLDAEARPVGFAPVPGWEE